MSKADEILKNYQPEQRSKSCVLWARIDVDTMERLNALCRQYNIRRPRVVNLILDSVLLNEGE